MTASSSPLTGIPLSFPSKEQPFTRGQNARFQILRSTTPEEWRAALQCCHHLSLAAHATPFDARELKRLQFSVATHLLSHPQLTTRMAFVIGLTRQIQANTPSLETQFAEEATAIDLHNRPDFASFLVPNEKTPLNISPHLAKMGHGLIVSTGTERGLFDAILSDPTKFEGLVGRDFDPEVKAYIDFNVLLLRIAENREDYLKLSNPFPPKLQEAGNDSLDDSEEEIKTYQQALLQNIRSITEKSNLPPHIKKYYLDHLEDFGRIYFKAMQKWYPSRGLAFQGVKYYEDNALFEKLQRYAKSGNIIATVGDMSDLRFLDKRNIALLDISNIPDYSFLNFKMRSNPIVVSTKMPNIYRSSVYHPLTAEQTKKLDDLINVFKSMNRSFSRSQFGTTVDYLMSAANPNASRSMDPTLCYYSKNLLDALTKHKNQYCLQIEDEEGLLASKGWVDFSPGGNLGPYIQRFSTSPVGLEKEYKLLIPLIQFLILAGKINHFPQSQLLAFTKLPSWPAARLAYNHLKGSQLGATPPTPNKPQESSEEQSA